MPSHSPLPWAVSGPDRDHPYLAWIMGADGLSILAISEDNLPDANLIVAAVNGYAALQERLEAAVALREAIQAAGGRYQTAAEEREAERQAILDSFGGSQ